MKIKTSELIGAALDWAAANCDEVVEWKLDPREFQIEHQGQKLRYSTDWAQGGPIIEREGIRMHRGVNGHWWAATDEEPQRPVTGPTPLVAALRCYIASKMGDEVDIPD